MISFRFPHISDSETLREWRTDAETCRQSRNIQAPSRSEHVLWFTRVLRDKKGIMVIAEIEGELVGSIRASYRGSVRAKKPLYELSYTIAPRKRGKGYGRKMVLKFVEEYCKEIPIVLSIRKGNMASERIAMALGLKPHGETTESCQRIFREWK